LNRQQDVLKVLDKANVLINGFERVYQNSKSTEDEIDNIDVTSCLTCLHNALNYIAVYLSTTIKDCKKKPKCIYFPYGRTQHDYLSMLQKNLPGLDSQYHPIIESVQPHKCDDNWLIQLIKLNNINKHDHLSKYERKASSTTITTFNKFNIIMGDDASITAKHWIIEGQIVNPQGSFTLTNKKSNADIDAELPLLKGGIQREREWVRFKTNDSESNDILELLTKSHNKISDLAKNVFLIKPSN
jgi:hypothetical protein